MLGICVDSWRRWRSHPLSYGWIRYVCLSGIVPIPRIAYATTSAVLLCVHTFVCVQDMEYSRSPFNAQLIGRMSQDDFRSLMRAAADYTSARDHDEASCFCCFGQKLPTASRALLDTLQQVNSRTVPNGASVSFVNGRGMHAIANRDSLHFDINQGVRPRR